jgi:uroporphyrinogen decarboxylase
MTEKTSKSSWLKQYSFAAFARENQADLRLQVKGYGGTVQVCDAYSNSERREIAREQRQAISALANQILTGEIDFLVFVTAAGVDFFFEQAARAVDQQRLVDCLCDMTTVAGSALAAEALRSNGIAATIALKTPGSWREIMTAMDQKLRVANFFVAVEESPAMLGLHSGIEARGGRILTIPVYPLRAPQDPETARDIFQRLADAQFQAVLLASSADAAEFLFFKKQFSDFLALKRCVEEMIVISFDRKATELLRDRNIEVDFTSDSPATAPAILEIAQQISAIAKEKEIRFSHFSGPGTSVRNPNAPWYNSPFMKACRGEPTEVTPVWLMRQAGRYMPEYREVRAKVGFLELCANPQLCSEVMCTAVDRLGVDAAIIFSDLLPMLVPMGMDLEFSKGDGPVIHNPVREASDIGRVRRLENTGEVEFVMQTVRQTRNDLPEEIPLIGFAGAPFTLASYMIEGGSSRNYAHTKKLMYSDHGAWSELMEHLVHSISVYLQGQIAAGAQVIQLFDSWAGCLGYNDYRQFVLPFMKKLIDSLPNYVPLINFATGNPSLLPLLADTRAPIIGVDWRIGLDQAWEIVGHSRGVQGNLDPTVLLTDPQEIRRQVKQILDQAASRPGHIFNLGHGILPQTPVQNAIAMVDAVHELSQRKL